MPGDEIDMKIIRRQEIEQVLPQLDLIPAIERGFVDYSAGRATIPPVGELLLPDGEVHIKYGYVDGGEHYVIKIASGFSGNPALGLPSGDGMMLLFSQRTGEPTCLLLDEALLTDVRTAVSLQTAFFNNLLDVSNASSTWFILKRRLVLRSRIFLPQSVRLVISIR